MSKGLGRIERQIVASIASSRENSGCVVLGSSGLACACFPVKASHTIAARKAVVRAMHSFCRKFPQYALMGGNGRKALVLYEPADPNGVKWAKEIVESRCVFSVFLGFFRDGAGNYNEAPVNR